MLRSRESTSSCFVAGNMAFLHVGREPALAVRRQHGCVQRDSQKVLVSPCLEMDSKKSRRRRKAGISLLRKALRPPTLGTSDRRGLRGPETIEERLERQPEG
jgi:hypothetical protein